MPEDRPTREPECDACIMPMAFCHEGEGSICCAYCGKTIAGWVLRNLEVPDAE